MKKPATEDEKRYLGSVADLGCLICGAPAEIHHIRKNMGLGQRNDNKNVLPLCHLHHRNGGYGIAFHAGKKEWQRNHGTEQKLLEQMRKQLKGDHCCSAWSVE